MSKIIWDKETGGVKFSSYITKETLGVSPRPVFFEELDLLKLKDFGWKYPKSEEPLLWACNKQYFYRGKLVFEAKGANIYNAPKFFLQPGAENLKIEPVDVKAMLNKCKDEMFLIESEAIEFIRNIYLQYSSARKSVENIATNQIDFESIAERHEKKSKKKMAIIKEDCDSFDIMPLEDAKAQGKKVYQTTRIDKFLASFSGGKDSQVVLDLCTRAIPPSEFEVIYSDTGYELPTSLSLYEKVEAYYHNLYPELKFSTARNHETVFNYWDKIGTPSDAHRWCCSVMKTAPLYRMLKIDGTNKQAKVLTFEGVRAEESTRRSGYNRIGRSVKHNNITNARPIFDWNTTEIFLYLFKYKLPINLAYRQGHARVGCIICPYSTSWDDMINNALYKKELKPFLSRIEKSAEKGGIKDVQDYIKERKWKLRSSGNYIDVNSAISFEGTAPILKAKVKNAKQDIERWLPTIGVYTSSKKDNTLVGEIKFDNTVYSFSIEYGKNANDFRCTLQNNGNAQLIKYFKRILYKTTYCINCEVCEVECPTGALSVYPEVKIDKSKCTHCHKCLDFHDNGCIVANSLILTTETNMKAKSGIDRYNTFGLREEWLDMFFADPENYWNNNGLGTKQVPAIKNWLKDSEIIDSKNQLTEIGKLLSEIYIDQRQVVWEIIWINLTYNSFIVQWFTARLRNNVVFSKTLLKEMIQQEFSGFYSDRTIKNAIDALIRTLKETPIGSSLYQLNLIDKENSKREAYDDLSEIATAYSIYKYAENHNIKSLRVSDFYQNEIEAGVFVEFGIDKQSFEKSLRTLNSSKNRVLVAELNMGLDHITLREDLTAFRALRILTR